MDENKTPSALAIATGRQIAAERTAAGYSLREFAALSGVSAESLHRYEHAQRDAPLKALVQIADALGIPVSRILVRAEERVADAAARSDPGVEP
jgi:transcriptional regulator with XRE-family HTH domain